MTLDRIDRLLNDIRLVSQNQYELVQAVRGLISAISPQSTGQRGAAA